MGSGEPAAAASVRAGPSTRLFFFQAEDGIRYHCVTGVQTCALPISFRNRRVRYTDCSEVPGGKVVSFNLVGGRSSTIVLGLRGDVLFRDRLDPATAKLRFDPFARADDDFGDHDGAVTLDELSKMTLAQAGIGTAELTVGTDTVTTWTTFEDFVYVGLFPHVVGYGAVGPCTAALAKPRSAED